MEHRLPFVHARRNFPTDTNGTDHIWLSGGYDVDGLTPLASMEIFTCPQASPTPTPTATATATATVSELRRQQLNPASIGDANCYGDSYRYPGAKAYANAQAASYTSTSAVRSGLARVFRGLAINSRVPASRMAEVFHFFT